MPKYQRNLPNFYIVEKGDSKNYTYRKSGGGRGKKSLPLRHRKEHAETLQKAFEQALENYQQQKLLREPELTVGEAGFYVEFQLPKSELKALDFLENKPKKIELLAVRSSDEAEETVSATVFIPEAASDFFLSKIEAYRDKDTITGKPQNEPLIARLDDISLGTVRALFTDDLSLFPSESQEVWWEVWLRHGCRESFQQIAEVLDIRITQHFTFPEREVVLTLTSVVNLSRIIINNGLIAELRLAKDSPSMFFEMDMQEQISWVKELGNRTIIAPNNNLAVCLLDSGVTRSHSLIEPALAREDCLTYHPNWGVADSKKWEGHGTAMAGIALYGNLYNALATSNQIYLNHRLESVKILPDQGENDPKLYGAITREAVSRIEINNPKRQRVICMPVTSKGDNNKGVPSSWSAAVDQICFEFQRLIVIPVGNIPKPIICGEYPNRNDLSAAENPSQAWNALVVGAYTDKVNIENPKYAKWQIIAPAGDLSPGSRTSLLWTDKWPIRPDVTFEGGNLATDDTNSPGMDLDDLRLLTTYYQPNVRQFNLSGDTSAATALCSHMAARIWAKHPEYWAETVRALIVHSAEWTPKMLSNLPRKPTQGNKVSILLRRYGYGVPNLERALLSSKNDLTMICEDKLQPFHRENSQVKTKEMNLHILPWPTQELENLREAKVEMRVTLSYFIEPNPGERGWENKHSYTSYGLRLAVKRSTETLADFRKRINKQEQETEGNVTSSGSEDSGWFLGPKTWNRGGSIHSDIWKGTAAELAQKDSIGIYPVSGWWKYNPRWEGWNKIARYALIVSIRVVDEVEADLYTPISISPKIKQTVPINL